MKTDHFIDLFARRPAAVSLDETWDIRITEFQRQLLCECLSCLSNCDNASLAKLTEARELLIMLLPSCSGAEPGTCSNVW